MTFIHSAYWGMVPPSFDFVPNSFDVMPCHEGTIEQEGEVLVRYTVFNTGRMVAHGVTISKKKCVELLKPVLGDVEIHLKHSIYQVDFPIHVTLEMVTQSGLTFKTKSSTSFHVLFEDLKVKVLFDKNALTVIARFHPEMESEEQVSESHIRLLAALA